MEAKMKKTISCLVLYFTFFITNAAIASESAVKGDVGSKTTY